MTTDAPFAAAAVALLLFSIVMYLSLDGFDLGIGMLLLLQRRNSDRREMMEIIATAWDGNESWLVLIAIVLFGGFPLAFSTLLPGAYLPLITMLMALVIRGIAIEAQSQSETYAPGWGAVFGIGSLVAAVSQGVIAGAVISGLPVVDRHFAGGPFAFVHPLCILTAAWLVWSYLLIGAGWLNDRAVGELQAWSKRVLRRGAVPAALLAATTLVLSLIASPIADVSVGPRLLIVVLTAIVAGGAFWAVAAATAGTRDGRPFGFAELALLSATLGLAASIYPYLVPPSVTFWGAASPNSSEIFLLVGVGGCIPIVLTYNAYAYYVFRGKFVVPLPKGVAAIAPLRRVRRGGGAPQAVAAVGRAATEPDSVAPLAWLRNVGWIAVWTVLYFVCINSFGGILGDRGGFIAVLVLIGAMVTIWIVTDQRDCVG